MSANLTIDLLNTTLFVPSIISVPNAVYASGAFPGSAIVVGISGAPIVGQWVDMKNTDTYCNLWAVVGTNAGPTSGGASGGVSGAILIAVQTAEGLFDVPLGNDAFSGNIFSGGAPMSGNFSDPTSGLAQFPTTLSSGGVWILNSGLSVVPGQVGASGQLVNGYTQGTLPFGPNPVWQGQNGPAFPGSGAWPEMYSGGVAYAAFQRNFRYCRLVLLSGSVPTGYIAAGFIANLMTTGSGGGTVQQPLTQTFVNV